MNIVSASGIFIVLVLSVFGFFLLVKRLMARRRLLESLRLKLLSIQLPQKTAEKIDQKEALSEINLSSQLLNILVKLKDAFVLETAVQSIGQEINFYLAVPRESVGFVTRQIQGFWPEARIEETDDYNIFNSQGAADAAYLKQKQSYILPIRTYLEAGLDTFLPILSNLSKIEPVGEGIAIQVLIKPAPASIKKNIANIIHQLKKGASLSDLLERKFHIIPKTTKEGEEKEPKIIEEDSIKALEEKIAKPIFSVNLRLVASAATPMRAGELLDSLIGSFSQFAAPLRNEFKIVKPHNPRSLLSKFIFREYDNGQTMILNNDELVSLFHLPTSTTAIPRIKWLKSKEAPPPPLLPKKGVLIGENVFRGERRPIFIDDDDRRRHVYVVGQTGTGKSNLLINTAIEDIKAGKGVSVIDPHGDLIDALLTLIPRERLDDVIIFNPGDIWRPIGLNMLEYDPAHPEQKTFIVNEMQSIFNRLFVAETMGPMFEQYMRNALLLLMEDFSREAATLIEVPRVFTDSEYRQEKLSRIANPIVIDFWEKEAVKAGGEAALANMTPYITSKFNNFIANDFMRPIIGQPKSAFDFRKIMDERKILLVNLSKGRIGDINANLLGMIIVGKLLMAAFSRVDIPQEQRIDFNLYIDEFQNFTTESIATILSEARKYRLNLVIAHQFIGQLDEKIRDAVFGNVGSMIVFRVGAEDAEFLIKQFEPIFSKNDLINIDNFNACAKLLILGQTSKPFNIRTFKAGIGNLEAGEKLKEKCRSQYGRDRQEVEAEILKRLRA